MLAPDATADEVIDAVHEFLSEPGRWHGDNATREGDFCTGGALNAEGRQVQPDDPTAKQFCILGAFKYLTGVVDQWPLPGEIGKAFDRVGAAAGWEPGMCHNDRDGYEAVMAALEKARLTSY